LPSRPSKEAVPESTTTGTGTYPKDVPASRNTRIERTGNGRIGILDGMLYRWHRYDSGMDSKLMNPWEYCNSLRYGFDEEYDSPVFDDEDISEEKETNE
jgi:hypothetical protein